MTDLHLSIAGSSSAPRQILPQAADPPVRFFPGLDQAPSKLDSGLDFSPSVEQTSVSSRCSVRLFHEIISKFCPKKVELVKSIGFEGVLHIPLLKQINLKFSTWLMSRVDELSNSLVISEGSGIEFNKHDVARVFGIPSDGLTIECNLSNLHCYSSEAVCSGLSPGIPLFRSIKAAQTIVSRQLTCATNYHEQDEFRAAFVVFVMSTVLAPASKHDRVSDDFIHAILQPSLIAAYDWAEYVLRRLIDAVRKLKQDISSNVKAPYIYGCSLFLQVLYLDSIDLGGLSMPHDVFPRIKCFTAERLRAMIAADPSFNLHAYNIHVFHKPLLRDPSVCCYYWASSKRMHRQSSAQESRLLSLWHCSLSMTRVLKIPPEAAGPLFIAAAGCPDALKFIDVIFHLIEPYMNGFSYRPSICTRSCPFEFCSSRSPAGCLGLRCCAHLVNDRAKRKRLFENGDCSKLGTVGSSSDVLFHGSPVGTASCNASEDVEVQAISAMARFYLELTPVKPTRCSDLNLIPASVENGYSAVLNDCCFGCPRPRTPWQIGHTWTIDTAVSAHVLNKLANVDDIDDPWFAHFCPKYIEVSTRAVKDQFLGKSELELEMVDASIRRFKQIDDELYANEGTARWRHYVESDFMVTLLAGKFNITDPVVRAHFYGRHIKYDVTGCRMFIFPAILQCRWACFVWRIEDNTIVVYDPCSSLSPQSEMTKIYARVAKVLKSAMVMVSSFLFHRWAHRWQDARIEVCYPENVASPRWNRSGLMCLHFCRFFDGGKVIPPLDIGKIDALAGMFLGEVSELADNFGVVPISLKTTCREGKTSMEEAV